jgi:MFS transporter, putative metabolite:H+ symporter
MQQIAEAEADTVPVALRLDRIPVTRLHVGVVVVCALGFMFDTMEMALGSGLAAVFSTPPHVAARGELALLLSAVYAGAVPGAVLFGWIADRHGRRLTMIALLWLMALASAGAAHSTGLPALAGWRCLAGFALGAFPPLMTTYLTDLLPPARRGLWLLVAIALGMVGPGSGILLVRALTPVQMLGMDGWRWAFVGGAAGSAVVALLFVLLPESPRWLAARGRQAEAERAVGRFAASRAVASAGTPAPPAPGPARRHSWPVVAGLYLLSPWSTVAFPVMSGVVLAQKGHRIGETLLYVGLSSFGPVAGTLIAGLGIDRLDRRLALSICAVALCASGLGFVTADGAVALVVSSFCFALFVSLMLSVLNLYGGESFSTAGRARGLAWAWGLNRIGAAAAPFVLLPLLHAHGPYAMFAVIAASLAASLVLLAMAGPAPARRAVT